MEPLLSFPTPLSAPLRGALPLALKREGYAATIYRAAFRAEKRARADLAAAAGASAHAAALAGILGLAASADSPRDKAAQAVRLERDTATHARRSIEAQDTLAAELDVPPDALPDPGACTPCVLLPPHPTTGVRWWIIPVLCARTYRGVLLADNPGAKTGWDVTRLVPAQPPTGRQSFLIYRPFRFLPSCIA